MTALNIDRIDTLMTDVRAEVGNAGFAAAVDMDSLALECLEAARSKIDEAIRALRAGGEAG